MSRKRKVVEIDEKKYTVKELTIAEIIDLTENSIFFSDTLKEKETDEQREPMTRKEQVKELMSMFTDVGKVMEISCDFTVGDLKKLTPSQVREIYDKWREVNSDFFEIVKVLGVTEALKILREVALENFSNLLVAWLKQDT